MIDPPAEAVEAAARALAAEARDEVAFQPVRLDGVTRSGQAENFYLRVASDVLRAALPHLLREAYEYWFAHPDAIGGWLWDRVTPPVPGQEWS